MLSAGKTLTGIWKCIWEGTKHKGGNEGKNSEADVISGTGKKGQDILEVQIKALMKHWTALSDWDERGKIGIRDWYKLSCLMSY